MDAITPDSFLRRRSLRAQVTRRAESTGDSQSEIVIITSSAENQGASSPTNPSGHALPGRRSRVIAQGADEIEMAPRGASLGSEGESIASDPTTAAIIVPARMRNIPLIPSIYTSCVLAMRALRRAHHTATQAEVRQSQAAARVGGDTGWGLGNYGLREREEAESRIRDFQAERRRRMLLRELDGEDDEGWHDEEGDVAEMAAPSLPSHRDEADPSAPPLTAPTAAHTRSPLRHQESDGSLPHPFPPSDSLYWRWGPLRRWRLQDRTNY